MSFHSLSEFDFYKAEIAVKNSAANYGKMIAGFAGNNYSARNNIRTIRDVIINAPWGDSDEKWNALLVKADRMLILWNAVCPEIA